MSIFQNMFLGSKYRTLDELDKDLKHCKTLDDLKRLYTKAHPDRIVEKESETHACGGAASMIADYLTRKPQGELINKDGKELSDETSDAVLSAILQAKAPYYGYLVWAHGDHDCIFAKTGSRWGFYQANYIADGDPQNFTLSQHLNMTKARGMLNWNKQKMNERDFVELFRGLTQPNAGWLFHDNKMQWSLVLRSFEGKSLLDNSFKAAPPQIVKAKKYAKK